MIHRQIFAARGLSTLRASGQAAAPTVAPAPLADAPEIRVGPDGRLTGIDGLLDQISLAVLRNAVPMVRDEILPVIQQDKEMQRTVGEAAGRGAADEVKPYLVLLSASIVLTGVLMWKSRRPRKPAKE